MFETACPPAIAGFRIVAVVALAAILTAIAAASAAAKIPPPADGADPPGITMTGIGFARASADGGGVASPLATRRALGDARRRAAVVAATVGVPLGQPHEVQLREISQFRAPGRCRRGGDRPLRCRRFPLTVAAATVSFEVVGGSDDAAARGIGASGAASAAVVPADRARNDSIRRALLDARRQLPRRAAAAALRNVRTLARSSGLALGPIVSISEAAPLYFQPSFYDPALGSFGPGRYCGFVRRPVVRRDPETGAPRVVRRRRERRCFFTSPYELRLEVRYAAR